MEDKNNVVEIVPNDLGAKIRVSANNPEYAHVLLKQQKTVISPNGWVNSKTLHALLHGKVESIRDIGIATLDTLPGQIVVKEQLTPFNVDNPEADYKYAGDSGIVCCQHGEPIYRKCFYDPTMLDTDILVAHTNTEDIRNAMLPEGTSDEDIIASMVSNVTEDTEEKEEVDPNQTNLVDAIAEIEADNSFEEETPGNVFDEDDDEEDVVIAGSPVEESEEEEEEDEDEVEVEDLVEIDHKDDDLSFTL